MKATIMSPDFVLRAIFSAAEMQPPPEPPVKMASCFVAHLQDVVENLQVHCAGEKIFADAFDDVGEGLAGVSRFHFFVVERADGVHADNFDVRIFFFQVATDA
jgi:hypothetical protein